MLEHVIKLMYGFEFFHWIFFVWSVILQIIVIFLLVFAIIVLDFLLTLGSGCTDACNVGVNVKP